MKTEILNRWLSLGANVGVLIGIVFLAIEIQQNTEMTRAQMIQSRAEASVTVADMTVNSEHIPAIIVKNRSGERLTAEESVRYDVWLRATLRNQDNNIQQYNQGLLGNPIDDAPPVQGTDPLEVGLVINEVHYDAEPKTEFVEFIELLNVGTESINLNLVRFANGIDFTFPAIDLAPDEYVLVVKNEQRFRLRYPAFNGVIAGEYLGNLDSNGETVFASSQRQAYDALCAAWADAYGFDFRDCA